MKGLIFVILFLSTYSHAATTWYSLSLQSDPNTLTNWTLNSDGSGGSPVNFTTAGDIFIVQISHSYTTTAIWNISAATQTVTVNGTLTYSHASSITNLTLGSAGTVNAGTQNTISGTWTMVSGSTYNFNHTTTSNSTTTFAGTESFNSASILKFSSFQTTAHAFEACYLACTGGFPSIIWNMTAQAADIDLESNPVTVNGDFTLQSTGAGSNCIFVSNGAGSDQLTVSGNLTISGGILRCVGGVGPGTVQYITVVGNVSISNGTLDFSDNGSYAGNLYVAGNFTHTAGTISNTGVAAASGVFLNGTSGAQTLESTGTSNAVVWTVAGSNAQCNIAAGKTFVLSASATLTVSAGTSAPDILVDGTITRNGGTVTLSGTGTVSNTGMYTHNVNNTAIPAFTWNATSTCNVTGVTSGSAIGTKNKTFGNFIWNCASQSATINLEENTGTASVTINGTMTVVNTNSQILAVGAQGSGTITLTIGTIDMQGGTLTLNVNVNTVSGTITTVTQSGGTLNLDGGGSTSPNTISVSGNVSITAGTTNGTSFTNNASITIGGNLAITGTGVFHGSSSTGDPTINITGTVTTVAGTTFYGTTNSGGIPTFNIQGAVDLSAGTTGSSSASLAGTKLGTYNLTGAGTNTVTLATGLTSASNANWSWTVSSGRTVTLASNVEIGGNNVNSFANSGILIMGTYLILNATGATTPTFSNLAAATLKTGNTAGLSTTAATGSIQVTGTIVYSSAASYVFNGTSAQVTGNFGVSTTPTASTVLNLEFNNTTGVTLSAGLTVANAGTLTLTSGYHNLSSFTLQVGTTAATTLTYTAGGLYSSTDNGTFKRYIPTGAVTSTSGNYYGLFPFKKSVTSLNFFEMNSTSNVTTAGFISAVPKFAATILDVTDYSDGNGTVTHVKSGKAIDVTLTTIAGGTFDLKLSSGTFGGGTLTDYTLVTYTGPGVVASSKGIFGISTGSSTLPVLNRTGIATADLANGWVVGTYNQGVTTLPIELTSFTGQKLGLDNLILWSTITEKNNESFTIEKTTDGAHFEVVGIVIGVGNSSSPMVYTLNDYNVRSILNYYRLKQTDFDGQSTFSDIISIDNTGSASKEVVKMVNILGQEVNEFYRGIVVIYYSDGTSTKVIQ